MYEIAICEDEPVYAAAMESVCREILEELGVPYCIRAYSSGGPLLEALRTRRFHLYLLDVVMEGISGMELADSIRQRDNKGAIIFTTSSLEYVLDGYRVGALRYLLKPVEKGVLGPLLREEYRKNFLASTVLLSDGSRKVRVPVDSIVYLEKVVRRIKVSALTGPEGREKERTLYFSGKMSQLLEQLPEHLFVQCHQGYCVNIAMVSELDRKVAVTPLGNVPVSRTYGPAVQKAFLDSL